MKKSEKEIKKAKKAKKAQKLKEKQRKINERQREIDKAKLRELFSKAVSLAKGEKQQKKERKKADYAINPENSKRVTKKNWAAFQVETYIPKQDKKQGFYAKVGYFPETKLEAEMALKGNFLQDIAFDKKQNLKFLGGDYDVFMLNYKKQREFFDAKQRKTQESFKDFFLRMEEAKFEKEKITFVEISFENIADFYEDGYLLTVNNEEMNATEALFYFRTLIMDLADLFVFRIGVLTNREEKTMKVFFDESGLIAKSDSIKEGDRSSLQYVEFYIHNKVTYNNINVLFGSD